MREVGAHIDGTVGPHVRRVVSARALPAVWQPDLHWLVRAETAAEADGVRALRDAGVTNLA